MRNIPDLGKQCRHRSYAPECGIWPVSTLFAIYSAVLYSQTDSKTDRNKFSDTCGKKYNWIYQGNATVKKNSLHEHKKKDRWGKKRDKTNATYETTEAQRRTATTQPPWDDQ